MRRRRGTRRRWCLSCRGRSPARCRCAAARAWPVRRPGPGQLAAQLLGQRGDRRGDRVADGLRRRVPPAPDRCGPAGCWPCSFMRGRDGMPPPSRTTALDRWRRAGRDTGLLARHPASDCFPKPLRCSRRATGSRSGEGIAGRLVMLLESEPHHRWPLSIRYPSLCIPCWRRPTVALGTHVTAAVRRPSVGRVGRRARWMTRKIRSLAEVPP